ncbi:MAG: hypothetical protein SFH39_01445 [Candidatus Magnetobacterium sp. LHC-1]|uniref:DUF4224 domain-containing protein n=1 Tax=Candidatus Magnetobacterium casense TaxID=1455061 RepID=A0ABS6RXX2_9BACT|nr:hypothetical protein [Candidatus Magnetobacterium casensis]MBF0607095.1 hypothetical protein [Nitrospirota bacterium]MBV6341093.1 hypothetical protein [Candidatus Magnetobacterium casensis]
MEKQDVILSEFEFPNETTEKIINKELGYQRARDRQIALMRKGLYLGTDGKFLPVREELHARG